MNRICRMQDKNPVHPVQSCKSCHQTTPYAQTLSPIILALLFLSACGGKVVTPTEAAKPQPPPPKPPSSVPFWLGNASRNFYGTGPWSKDPLQVVWSFETKGISGRLHKDPWGGSSWPGQPSVDDKHVYFGSADGRLYCPRRKRRQPRLELQN
jgi:hypothetical protein